MTNSIRFHVLVLILVLITIPLITCDGGSGGDGEVTELTPNDIIVAEVSGAENPENPIVAIAVMKDGSEAISLIAERDAECNPTRLVGAIYISDQGFSFLLQIGDDGLPLSIIDSFGNTFIFENYTDTSVDILTFDPMGNLVEGPLTLDVDPSALVEITDLFY